MPETMILHGGRVVMVSYTRDELLERRYDIMRETGWSLSELRDLGEAFLLDAHERSLLTDLEWIEHALGLEE